MTRAHPRFATAVQVVLTTPSGDVAGETANLSHGGLCADVSEALDLGVDRVITLALLFADQNRSESITVRGRVVWCTPIDSTFQVGIQFTSISPGAAADLALFLRFLAGTLKTT